MPMEGMRRLRGSHFSRASIRRQQEDTNSRHSPASTRFLQEDTNSRHSRASTRRQQEDTSSQYRRLIQLLGNQSRPEE